jgi:hypothetical protein
VEALNKELMKYLKTVEFEEYIGGSSQLPSVREQSMDEHTDSDTLIDPSVESKPQIKPFLSEGSSEKKMEEEQREEGGALHEYHFSS